MLVAVLVFFVIGRWRYDVVAVVALLVLVIVGIVPAGEAFAGFGHPAVITVAAVLIMSRGLVNAGVVDLIAKWMSRMGSRPIVQLAGLTGVVTVASGFMNNVGALALMMPVAIRMARKSGVPPSLLLMPLAFGSLLGGMLTLIGTPPNIIVASYRAQTDSTPFRMFDFTPVGAGVALAGIAFIVLLGWRLIPRRSAQASGGEVFALEEYTSEAKVPDGAKAAGMAVGDVEKLTDGDVTVAGLIRGERSIPIPSALVPIQVEDLLVIEANADDLKELVDAAGLELVSKEESVDGALGSEEVSVVEGIVTPDSMAVGRSPQTLDMRWNYGVNLLAVARHGARVRERLANTRFRIGDILLLQGKTEQVQQVLSTLRLLPLAEREVLLGYRRRLLPAIGIFALALVLAAVGLLPAPVALVSGAVAMVLVGLLNLRQAYDAVDWPIIVLLAAMIPVGQALEATGATQTFVTHLLGLAGGLPMVAIVALVLVGAMLLSDVINNAAAAVLMVGIAAAIAQQLGVSADPFLMAVAVGASCAFLTPIGHQSNTLVMGPGGYRFGDYWRMGLPLEVVVVAVALPLIMLVWPPA